MTKQERINAVQKELGLYGQVMTYGNRKLPKSTLIFNHSTATECPSNEFCAHAKVCYAKRDERLYKKYYERNMRNYVWFKNATISDIKKVFTVYIEEASSKHPIKHVRLNEAGDFINQEAIDKFNIIALWLKEKYNIITYAYTCRIDLDFSYRTFILNASHESVNSYDRLFKCTDKETYKSLSKKDVKCYGKCGICKICFQPKYKGIVYCEQH